MTVLILAAGEAKRLNGVKKQLLTLKTGETIISRTLRQCRKREASPVIVTRDGEIAAQNGGYAFVPSHYSRTVNTFLSTAPVWGNETIILLGDVVYSEPVMDRIFASDDLAVFGHELEIFAVTFRREHHKLVRIALQNTAHPGKLRTFHQSLTGVEQGGNAHKDKYWQKVCHINDWTADIDTWEDWEDVKKKDEIGKIV